MKIVTRQLVEREEIDVPRESSWQSKIPKGIPDFLQRRSLRQRSTPSTQKTDMALEPMSLQPTALPTPQVARISNQIQKPIRRAS